MTDPDPNPGLERRLELQTLLEGLLPDGKKVYFQPPAGYKMEYPCIVYNRDYVKIQYADNSPYASKKRYLVTIIDRDPDSAIPDLVAALPYALFNRFFVADGLNHDVYNIYF